MTDLSIARQVSVSRQLIGAEVLVIDQDARVQKGMTQLLAAASLHVTCASDPDQGLALIDRKFFSVVIVDLDTPTPGSGLETTREVKRRSPTSMVVMLTPRKSFDDAVASLRAGAVDIIFKSPDVVEYLKDRVLEAAGRSVGSREMDSLLADVRSSNDDFLLRFMETERRNVDLADRLAGRDPSKPVEMGELIVLVVDENPALAQTLAKNAPRGYHFEYATGGGHALDKMSSGRVHYAMIEENLHDLPFSMVVRSIKTSYPEVVVLSYTGPGPTGKVSLVETAKSTSIIEPFTTPDQLLARIDELAEAFRAKERERRYTQAFRERHYDFLRRYVELKSKIERALSGS